MNRFSTKQYHFSNANNHQYINPFRVKRSYMTMLEQDHLMSSPSYIGSKRLKQSDNKTCNSNYQYTSIQIIAVGKPFIVYLPQHIPNLLSEKHEQQNIYGSIRKCLEVFLLQDVIDFASITFLFVFLFLRHLLVPFSVISSWLIFVPFSPVYCRFKPQTAMPFQAQLLSLISYIPSKTLAPPLVASAAPPSTRYTHSGSG